MPDDHIIYERTHISPLFLDERRHENREFFSPERDLSETTLLRDIINQITRIEEKPIINLNRIFYSKKENTLIKIFNETKINDFLDFDNRENPIFQGYLGRVNDADKSWQRLAANGQVTTQELDQLDIEELKNKYVQRLRQVAEQIINVARQSGASEDIDLNVLIKIIQLYQQRRENPKMDFFVNLAINGTQALTAHLEALSCYSPFTPEQLQNVFHAAAGQKIVPSVKRVFGHNERLYYRMQVHGHNPIEAKISAELEKRGYKVLSYEDGTAIKIDDVDGKQKYKIGKILKDNQTLQEQFRDDPVRQMGQFLIVLSRNPDDVAKMSTDRAWVSCMASTGMMGINNFHYVPKEIKQGALVAYVVKASDPNIYDPLSRILLKPYKRIRDMTDFKYTSEISRPDTIYVPGTTYGLPNQVFRDAVIEL